ncbi:MAG TPA: 50S ribosomal protein L11 methyltransferase [Polyangia bacterium]
MAGTQTWVELQVELPAEMAELLAAELAELVGGVEIRDTGTLFATAPDRAAVVALVEPDAVDETLAAIDDVLGTARAAGSTVDPVAIRRREAHEDEWRDVWKQFFRTTRIGRHFLVRPSWEPPVDDAAGDHVIDLDPGRAFGTGAHPSTRLVIAAMETLATTGTTPSRFLDLGCGSGILAIAAHRLWPAAKGLAVDNDPEATACTDENLARNRVTNVGIATGTLADVTGTYDLVIANIQRDVLESIAAGVPAKLAPRAHLILSGLLTSDADPVRVVYEGLGLRLAARNDDGEWASLVFARG